MVGKRLSTVVVVLMLVLAGCGGFGGEASDQSSSENDSVATQQQTERTQSDGGAESDGESGVVIVGPDQNEANPDFDAIARTHEQRLGEARSFTLVFTVEATGQDESGNEFRIENVRTNNVDTWNNLAYSRLEADQFGNQFVREEYARAGLTYVREGGVGPMTSQFRGFPPEWNVTELGQLSGANEIRSMDRMAEFERIGEEAYDGTTVVRYEASSLDAFDRDRINEGLVGQEVAEASAVLLVDTDGVVRYLELTVVTVNDEGREIEVIRTIEWSDVGSTTVTEPDWVADARAGN